MVHRLMFHVKRCQKAAVFGLRLSEYLAILEAATVPIQGRSRCTPLLSHGASKHDSSKQPCITSRPVQQTFSQNKPCSMARVNDANAPASRRGLVRTILHVHTRGISPSGVSEPCNASSQSWERLQDRSSKKRCYLQFLGRNQL